MLTRLGLGSLRERLREVERSRWVIGGLSVLATGIIVVTFLIENRFGYLKPDTIIAYFHSWDGALTAADASTMEVEERRVFAETDAIAAQLAAQAGDIDIAPDAPKSGQEPVNE